ncbi:MAG TPA: TOMM precursor leader peptide-binding protein [Fibrobacteria bacterium]|nr:TOMM precursor leader peptide-binding protein [Fibrobacteria bacterium]
MADRAYRLAPGLEITRMASGAYLLHSDFVAIEMGGDEAAAFVEHALAGLRNPRGIEQIASDLPGFTRSSVVEELERLCREGVLTIVETADPHEAAYEQVGMGAAWSREQLATSRIVIFGLEAHGAHLAAQLAGFGVRRLTLVDPFPYKAVHRALTPFGEGHGGTRAAVAARSLTTAYPELQVVIADGQLDAAAVERLLDGAGIAVACFDRGMVAAHHWINQAALGKRVPALFSELRATGALVGPLVIPGNSSCYMCLRMRSVAAKREFERVMAIEEHYDRHREPTLASRPLLPGVALGATALLAQEIVRVLLRIEQPTLVDRIVEFDILRNTQRSHPLVRVAECPSCGEKKKRQSSPSLGELLADDSPPANTLALVDQLVSARTGILTELGPVQVDPLEPQRPFVYRVHIANHQFLSERDDDRATCSGKGWTSEAAMTSAIGEGIERYASARWSVDEIVYSTRDALDHETLDPRRLVLYAEEQYKHITYARYTRETTLGWIPARSLVTGRTPWVPAIGVFMDYAVRNPTEFLFPVTSNGLAAGPTLAAAVLAATYEVLERDAFLMAWLHRWPGRSYNPTTHPDPAVSELAEAYRRRGVALFLVRLPVDHPIAVFVAIARQGDSTAPAAVVGLGADLDPLIAARRAAMEVAQVRPSLRRRCRGESALRVDELADDPTKVVSLEDHALLYASSRHVAAVDALVGEPAEWEPHVDAARDPKQALAAVVAHFQAAKQDLLYVDLTSEDIRPFGLRCARAILPDFQPIWFGANEPRLGGSRVRTLPVTLGRASVPVPLNALQALPHPLA